MLTLVLTSIPVKTNGAQKTGPEKPGEVPPEIQDVNSQLNVPYEKFYAKMTVEKWVGKGKEKWRKQKTYSLEFHLAVYPDGSEKNKVVIKEPPLDKADLLVERPVGKDIISQIKTPGEVVFIHTPKKQDPFLRSSLYITDFEKKEDTLNYKFAEGENENEIVAISRNEEVTYYSKRVIALERMPDGSWVEIRVDYFDSKGNLVKKRWNKNFVKIAPRSWRPKEIVFADRKKRTTLELSGWEVSDKIDEGVFRL
jgi:hypothetical protein